MIVKVTNKRETVALQAALNYLSATPEQNEQLSDSGQVDVDKDRLVSALHQLDKESHEDFSDYRVLAERLSSLDVISYAVPT